MPGLRECHARLCGSTGMQHSHVHEHVITQAHGGTELQNIVQSRSIVGTSSQETQLKQVLAAINACERARLEAVQQLPGPIGCPTRIFRKAQSVMRDACSRQGAHLLSCEIQASRLAAAPQDHTRESVRLDIHRYDHVLHLNCMLSNRTQV